ncbi:transaldolase [bacterium]|nr:MAG: transaldolase [bacterium]
MATETSVKSGPIAQLRNLGQSLWLDNIQRQLITSGELAKLRDEGVTGVTSNPTIFEKAVTGSSDYDEALARLVRAGRQPQQILWDLMVEDIQGAADVFRPVFDRTGGADGYVSIEVPPDVASSTQRTIAMAEELRERCGRPNVMVKIPATREGIPAIADQIGKGHNINVTLIFAVDRYSEVAEAFLSGLETFKHRGGDLSTVSSVASFFVSRVDTKVDALLQARIQAATDVDQRNALERLRGRAGIANSKRAYQRFKGFHSGMRWDALARAGARVQRCLWASTSTKNPMYRDTMYVEELIGPDTINTLPNKTLAAFADHGVVRRSLDEDVKGSRQLLNQLARRRIDLDAVTRELEIEGVNQFEKSYESLTAVLDQSAQSIRRARNGSS